MAEKEKKKTEKEKERDISLSIYIEQFRHRSSRLDFSTVCIW
jgi:hypothetical protein